MSKLVWLTVFLAASPRLFAPPSPAIEMANLREDVRLNNQRVGELALRFEELEQSHRQLRAAVEKTQAQLQAQALAQAGYVTTAQLNDTVAELNRALQAADTASVERTRAQADRTATQLKKLGDATNVALDALARNMTATRPASAENSPAATSSSAPAPSADTNAAATTAPGTPAGSPAAASSASASAATPATPRTAALVPPAPVFSTNYPKTGVTYTVVKGDTLAAIAKKTGAKTEDIINANKLADPGKIQSGRTLFIPGGK